MIMIPAAHQSSLEKNNNTLPIADAATPREIKTNENPKQNNIVFISTLFLSLSISFKFFPVIYEIYPGIIGNTHGDKKLINPAPNANANLMIIISLYLPLRSIAINILSHDLQIYWVYIHSYMVLYFYKITKYF